VLVVQVLDVGLTALGVAVGGVAAFFAWRGWVSSRRIVRLDFRVETDPRVSDRGAWGLLPEAEHDSDGSSGDAIVDAARVLKSELTGNYWQVDDKEPYYDDGTPLAPMWHDDYEDAVVKATQAAWNAQVVPAVAKAIAEFLRQNPPPAHLVAFEGSKQLRADLELVSRQ
jgi:hypothetical protein